MTKLDKLMEAYMQLEEAYPMVLRRISPKKLSPETLGKALRKTDMTKFNKTLNMYKGTKAYDRIIRGFMGATKGFGG